MKSLILLIALFLSFSSFASFTNCYKVVDIYFERDYAAIHGVDIERKGNGIASFGVSKTQDHYEHNIELAKFALAHKLQLCKSKETDFLSIKRK